MLLKLISRVDVLKRRVEVEIAWPYKKNLLTCCLHDIIISIS